MLAINSRYKKIYIKISPGTPILFLGVISFLCVLDSVYEVTTNPAKSWIPLKALAPVTMAPSVFLALSISNQHSFLFCVRKGMTFPIPSALNSCQLWPTYNCSICLLKHWFNKSYLIVAVFPPLEHCLWLSFTISQCLRQLLEGTKLSCFCY